jgi:hypothetical protein
MANGNRDRALPAALAVLGIGLVTTLAAWQSARTAAEASARQRFEKRAADVAFRIRHGFAGYESVLRSGAALLAVDRDVSREAWRNFVTVVDMERRYPGMVALGYARYLPTAELPELERHVRAYGLPRYEVWPKTAGPVHVPVVYSEPYEVAAHAYGFDMFAEPVRRAALSAARDTGTAALTGRLTLIYDQSGTGNPGFLVYVPVYRVDAPRGTVERRRRAIDGYAFGAFRVREALSALLAEFPEVLDVAVYNGAQPADAAFLYDAATVRVRYAEDDQVLGSGAPLLVDRPFHNADGSVRWLLKSKSRIALSDGSFGVAGLMTDVTALKLAEAAVRESEARRAAGGGLMRAPLGGRRRSDQPRDHRRNPGARGLRAHHGRRRRAGARTAARRQRSLRRRAARPHDAGCGRHGGAAADQGGAGAARPAGDPADRSRRPRAGGGGLEAGRVLLPDQALPQRRTQGGGAGCFGGRSATS